VRFKDQGQQEENDNVLPLEPLFQPREIENRGQHDWNQRERYGVDPLKLVRWNRENKVRQGEHGGKQNPGSPGWNSCGQPGGGTESEEPQGRKQQSERQERGRYMAAESLGNAGSMTLGPEADQQQGKYYEREEEPGSMLWLGDCAHAALFMILNDAIFRAPTSFNTTDLFKVRKPT
jgi:hypothetical protein